MVIRASYAFSPAQPPETATTPSTTIKSHMPVPTGPTMPFSPTEAMEFPTATTPSATTTFLMCGTFHGRILTPLTSLKTTTVPMLTTAAGP